MPLRYAANGSLAMKSIRRSTLGLTRHVCGSILAGHRATPIQGLEINGHEKNYRQGEYGTDLINDYALDFIDRQKLKPFLLYYPMLLTHDPFQPTPESADWDPKARGETFNTDTKHFAAMTKYMDKLIGKLLTRLEERGLRDNTLVIFLGDNGTAGKITSQIKNKPQRGGKGTTTHLGTHVPLIVNWPAVIKTGKVERQLVGAADFYPTLCQAAGVPIPANTDGVSMLPILRGESATARAWLYTWYSPRQHPDLDVQEFAFDERFKLYRGGKLFDLRLDPLERKPLRLDTLSRDAKQDVIKLQGVLDHHANTRPPDLDRQFLLKSGKKAGAK